MRLRLAGLAFIVGARILGGQTPLQIGDPLAPLRLLAAEAPDRIVVHEIGRSREGRPILAVTVSAGPREGLDTRPRVLLVAGFHADQGFGTDLLAALPGQLLALAQADPEVKALLARAVVEVIPLVNPDGHARRALTALADPRRTATPIDDDRDGHCDEDGPNDLDGDGVIRWMRVPDPRGDHRISDEDPRLMVAADPAKGEPATHRLLREGIDDDADGTINEDGPGGVDLDRNWPHGFRARDPVSGPWAVSEPETQALADHVLRRSSIALVMVVGGRDSVSKPLAANSAGDRAPPNGPLAEDLPVLEAFAKSYREIVGAGAAAADAPDGAFHQWAYAQRGILALATAGVHAPRTEEWPDLPSGKKPQSEEARRLVLLDTDAPRTLGAWRPFDHPTLGRVELGGLIEEDLRRRLVGQVGFAACVQAQARVVIEGLRRLPRLAWTECSVRALGRGVFEVKAVLVNEGVFPVISAMGRRTRSVMPTHVVLEREGAEFLVGRRAQKCESGPAAGRPESFRWILRSTAGGTLKLSARTEKAGTAETVLELPGEDR